MLLKPVPKFGGALSAAAAGPAAAAPEQRRQAALQIAQHIVQIVLRLLRAVPGIAFLAAGFVPSHALSLVATDCVIKQPAHSNSRPGRSQESYATRCCAGRFAGFPPG